MVVDGMVVPVLHATAQRAVERHGDEFDPRFDQAASQQALLPPGMTAGARYHAPGMTAINL